MRQFVTGMICGGALLFGAMHYHVIRGNDGVTLVRKSATTCPTCMSTSVSFS